MSLILDGTNGLSDIDGSAATPAIRGTDANTGIFFPAADTIAFAEGGAEVARFNADSQFVAAAGTAALPVFTTTGDVNTGIFFPAADTIAFAEGGAEAMRIDSSGRLSIGGTTVTDTHLLNIQGSTASHNIGVVLNKTNSTAQIWGITNSGPLAFYNYTGSSEVARFDTSGNFLVGKTTADGNAVLDVNGVIKAKVSLKAKNNASNVSYYEFEENSTNLSYSYIGGDARTTGFINFSTNATERARITSNGNVLLGKSDPSVDVNGHRFDPDGASFTSISTGNETHYVRNSTVAAYRFYVNAAGTVFATNTTISAISDIRYKENVRDLDVGLDKIMALKPRLFDWKEGKGVDIKNARGFIAQEFETVFPDLIDEWKDPAPEGEEPYKSVRQDLIPVLVKAIQEQQALITQLQADVAALKA